MEFDRCMCVGKRLIAALLVAMGLMESVAEESGRFALAEGGRALCGIAVDREATPTVHFAAGELKRHLEEATGTTFALVTNGVSAVSGPTIEIGTARAKEILGAAAWESLGREDSVVVGRGTSLAICGNSDAGVLYGVYAFLEREVGCRWYTQTGVNRVPKHESLSVSRSPVRTSPTYPYRWTLLADRLADCRDPHGRMFLLRNRLNMVEKNWVEMPRAFGAPQGGVLPKAMKVNQPTVHSLYFIIKKEELATHPDWFSLRDGKRVLRQLCFSNSELRRTFTERMLKHVETCGGKGYFDCSSRDEPGSYCDCPNCRLLEKKYGCVGGPFYDYLFELAEAVKAKHPEAFIHFLAYRKGQTQKPPKGVEKLPDNLIVVFAPIDDDQLKPWNHPHNVETYADLKAWCRMAKHVFGWYYPQVFVPVPQCSLSRISADTRLAREAGMDGCCYEHDYMTDLGFGFADMISWVLTKLYWNAEVEVWALAKDYCGGCYGAAADDMLAFARELDARAAACSDFVRWDESDAKSLTPANLVRWSRAFDVMERKAADDKACLQRIREVRYVVDLHVLRKWQAIRKVEPAFAADPEVVYRRMVSTLEASMSNRFATVKGEWYARQRDELRKGATGTIEAAYLLASHARRPLPPEFESIPEDEWLEFYPDRAPRAKMEDAALGFANYEGPHVTEEMRRTEPFRFGVFDYGTPTHPLIARTVEKSEIVPDEFHFYKVGRTAITSAKCRYWNSHSWRMGTALAEAFRNGNDFEYEVWASLKFEGPAYSEKSRKEKSVVYLDRVLLVKVKK